MAWNGSGVFQRLYSWVDDKANTIKVRADRMDGEFDNYKTGLENCLTRDGQNSPSAAISFNNQRLTDLGNATSAEDALNRQTGDGRYLLDGTAGVDDLAGVSIDGTPADNELLAYDTGGSQWINQTAAEAGVVATGDIGTSVQAYDAVLQDLAGATLAQGDVLYYNGSNLVNLGAGTSGQFLKTQGTGANPQWAEALPNIALPFKNESFGSSSTKTFSGLSTSADLWEMYFAGLSTSTGGVIQIRVSDGTNNSGWVDVFGTALLPASGDGAGVVSIAKIDSQNYFYTSTVSNNTAGSDGNGGTLTLSAGGPADRIEFQTTTGVFDAGTATIKTTQV